MKQTLKISIVRGGCRFATPLYLGGEYALTFEGERADEAKTLLVTRPQKDRDGNLIALAKSETANDGGVSLFLNRQALVDWFADCGAEDVDATVDAHVYVFDANGVVIADSDVTIEYRPVDFVISDKEFEKWSDHENRIGVLEDVSKSHDAAIADHEEEIANLHKADLKVAGDAAIDATAKADAALADAKVYSDKLYNALVKMEYVYDEEASTEEKAKFRRVTAARNSFGEHVLTVSEELYDQKESEVKDTFMYTDNAQVVTGEKTFEGQPYVPTLESTDDSSRKAASTGWVTKKLAAWWTTIKAAFLTANNSWTGCTTFGNTITFDASPSYSENAHLTLNSPYHSLIFGNAKLRSSFWIGGAENGNGLRGTIRIRPYENATYDEDGEITTPERYTELDVKAGGSVTITTASRDANTANGTFIEGTKKNLLRSANAAEVVVLSADEFKAIYPKDQNTIYMVKES